MQNIFSDRQKARPIRDKANRDMTDDFGTPLSAINADYQQSLVPLLLDIQRAQIENLKSMNFMECLTCSCLPGLERGQGTTPSSILTNTFTRKRINAFEERDCVAVSCTWEPASRSDDTKGKYYLRIAEGSKSNPMCGTRCLTG